MNSSILRIYIYIWCTNCKPTYFGAANWANPKFSNGYNSVILKAIIMKKSENLNKCRGNSKMEINEKCNLNFFLTKSLKIAIFKGFLFLKISH